MPSTARPPSFGAFARARHAGGGTSTSTRSQIVIDVSLCYGQQRKVLPIRMAQPELRTEADVRRPVRALQRRVRQDVRRRRDVSAGRHRAQRDPAQRGRPGGEIRAACAGQRRRRRRPRGSAAGKAYWGPAAGHVETPVYDRDRIGAGRHADRAGAVRRRGHRHRGAARLALSHRPVRLRLDRAHGSSQA